MDRTHGRSPSGVRVDGPAPHGHWKVVTLTAAVRLDGVPPPACLAFDGATDAACFETYVEKCLAPALRGVWSRVVFGGFSGGGLLPDAILEDGPLDDLHQQRRSIQRSPTS
jgi:hypothetical protein